MSGCFGNNPEDKYFEDQMLKHNEEQKISGSVILEVEHEYDYIHGVEKRVYLVKVEIKENELASYKIDSVYIGFEDEDYNETEMFLVPEDKINYSFFRSCLNEDDLYNRAMNEIQSLI